MMEAEFTIEYLDGNVFCGLLFERDWKRANSKDIKTLSFSFAKTTIKLQGYTRYNLTWETQAIVGQSGSRIANVMLVGEKYPEYSDLFIFDFRSRFVVKKACNCGDEYGNMTSNTWKEGIIGSGKAEYAVSHQ